MGLKLKWFRRRITFDGAMPAPERSIRRKEATSGTVVGVYRQSTNFEDYIEPVRKSYWEPPPQAIARATFRSSNPTTTSTNSPASSSSTARGDTILASTTAGKPQVASAATIPTTISFVSRPPTTTMNAAAVVIGGADTADKIGHAGNGALRRDMPPEPTYTPPQPPVRKSRSIGSLANAASKAGRYPIEDSSEDSSSGYELRTPRSVEVLSAPSPPKTRAQITPPPRVPPVVPIPRTTSANSLPLHDVPTAEPDYIVTLASEPSTPNPDPTYDSFEAIFERVQIRKPVSPPSVQRSAPTTPSTSSTASPTPRQREPVLEVTSVPKPEPASPLQPKSILKKRAPAPPPVPVLEAMSGMVNPSDSEPVVVIPTPPPRLTVGTSGRNVMEATPETPRGRETPPRQDDWLQMVPQVPHAVTHESSTDNEDDDDDSDEDLNWDFVQRHRSSINQTVAAQSQIDPEVIRNAPVSLRQAAAASSSETTQNAPRHPMEPIAQPRTLRGMRNQRARPAQEADSWPGTETTNNNGTQPHTPRARASDSNNSETSA